MNDHFNILFLSRRNAARSIFAEAAANKRGHGTFCAYSAGLEPVGEIDPTVLDILEKSRYQIAGLRPKCWDEFVTADAPLLDFVFTLCDLDAGEPVPRWPGRPVTADWRYPDPDHIEGEPWQRRKALSETLAGLERQIGAFMFLPPRSLDQISLLPRLEQLRAAHGHVGQGCR